MPNSTRSRNALKHGLFATDELFLSLLNRRERTLFNKLRTDLFREYEPLTDHEKRLVDRLAVHYFRLYRFYSLEHRATKHSIATPLADASILPHLDRFSRYDWRLERQLRAIKDEIKWHYFKRGNYTLSSNPDNK